MPRGGGLAVLAGPPSTRAEPCPDGQSSQQPAWSLHSHVARGTRPGERGAITPVLAVPPSSPTACGRGTGVTPADTAGLTPRGVSGNRPVPFACSSPVAKQHGIFSSVLEVGTLRRKGARLSPALQPGNGALVCCVPGQCPRPRSRDGGQGNGMPPAAVPPGPAHPLSLPLRPPTAAEPLVTTPPLCPPPPASASGSCGSRPSPLPTRPPPFASSQSVVPTFSR